MTSLSHQFTGSAVAIALALTGMVVPTAGVRADNGQKYDITCESRGYGEQFCAAPNRKVKLTDDFSGRCSKNDTWRYDDRGVYVRSGCAGRFRVTSNQYADGGYGNGEYDTDDYTSDGSKKKDNTGTVVAAVALGAGLLWLISQSGKNKKSSKTLPPPADTGTGNTGNTGASSPNRDWTNPDGVPSGSDPVGRLSASDRRAVDVCTREVDRDVRAKGGRDVQLEEVLAVAPGGQTDVVYVTARYGALFDSKPIIRTVECQVTGSRVTGYKLS